MRYFKAYKNLTEYTIVEAKDLTEVQNNVDFMIFRAIPCNEDGSNKLPEGYTKIDKDDQRRNKAN